MGVTRRAIIGSMLLAFPASVALAAADGDGRRVVVVELFTSQGCSSCPPANANLITLSRQPGVLALSYSVTYWDHLGWKDQFARPEFTDRQVTYEPALGERSPFTPQMVIQGRISRIGHRLSDVETAIASVPGDAGPGITLSPQSISIAAGTLSGPPADVWLVQYDPRVVEVPVRRGENSGRTLPHGQVVHRLARIGAWDGRATRIARPSPQAGLRTAILVQAPRGGAILAAATD